MDEAKLAVPFQYASLSVGAALTIYAFSELVAATNEDTNTIVGSSEASDHVTRAMDATLAMVLANIVLGIPARNHLPVLPNSVGLNPTTRQIDVGWKVRR